MSYKEKILSTPDKPGIYVFYDFDGVVLYVGRSSRLKGRLTEHFIRFNSSVIADSNLDPRDVASIRYWIFDEDKETRDLEPAFISKYQPRLNLSTSDIKVKSQTFEISLPDETSSSIIELILPEYSRDAPLVRLKNKAHLIHEMVLKFELAGVTSKGKRVLVAHCKELLSIAEKM